MAFGRRRGEAFENAVRPELATLLRVAKRLCGSSDLAEDLVQQTLVKAFKAWERFDGQYLRSWLIKILRNEFRSNLRGNHDDLHAELDEDVATAPPFWAEVEWRSQAERILAEVQKLPSDYRLTLQLCDVEEMTYEEAAKAMDVPIGTVRSRLFRARALIRKQLGAEFVSAEEPV